MYKIYSSETYHLSDNAKEKNTISNDNIEVIVEKLKKDHYYHMHIMEGEKYILYFDLDEYEHNIERFIDDFKIYMKERYNLKLDDDDFCYTTNTGKKGSYHITIPKFYATTKKQKEIMTKFYDQTDKITQKGMDLSIYNKKPFRLPNQTKGKIYNREKMKKGIYEEIEKIKTPHIIESGEMQDFILNHITEESKNIEDVEYILNEDEKKAKEKKAKKEKESKKKEIEKKANESNERGTDAEIKKIEKLLNILDNKYYDNFSNWRDIGFILKKYENNTKKPMKEIFDNFSKKSKKYSQSGVNEFWDSLKTYDIKINLGSLYFYAKESNLHSYKDIVRVYHKRVKIDITDSYLVHKIKEIAGHLFIYKKGILYCFDTEKKLWYENTPEILKRFINNELYSYVHDFICDAIEDMDYFDKQKKVLRNKCLTIAGKKGLVEEFATQFFNEYIEDIEFDQNYNLIGFNNGVFDLKNGIFRDYKYNDYMTTQTGYNYKEPTQEEIKKVIEILDKIETKKDRKILLMKILGNGLIGKSYRKFFLFNGCGGNGKSLISSFMKATLGNYFYKANINSLCKEQQQGGNPEMANMDKKRYIIFTEPEENQKIKNGIMKSLTGDKTGNGRQLFSNKTEFILSGTIILECNKKIPLQSGASEAEIERIVDFPFLSKFVEQKEMIDEENNIFLADKSIDSESFFSKYKHAFFKIIAKYAKEFLNEDKECFNIPEDIRKRSEEYISGSYVLLNLLKEHTEKTNDKKDYIKICDLFEIIKTSEIYINLTKDEKRKMTKKGIIEFFETNKFTANNYKARYTPRSDDKKLNLSNVLIGYKLLQEENNEEDF